MRSIAENYVEESLFGYVPVTTRCDWCSQSIPLTRATVSTFHISEHVTEQEHYCNDDHALKGWRKRSGNTE